MDTNVESNQPTEEIEELPPPTTEEIVARLTSPSQKVRLDLLARLSSSEIAEPELVIDGILSTLFVYSDSKSIAAVESLLKKLLLANSSNTQVLKYFLSNLRKLTIASLKAISTSSYEPRITLFRWHCIFLESCLKSVAGEGPILSLVVSNQSSLLSTFVDLSPRIRNYVFHSFVASLEQPDIFQLYTKQILEEEPTTTHIILVGLLLSHIKTHPSKLAQYKAKFLDWYTKVTLAAVAQPHELAHELFVPLLNSLDNSDFASSVIPALARALKRSPEVAAWNTATMLRLTTQKSFDSAQHKDALLPVVFPLVLGSSEKLRSDGINVLRQILLHTKTGPGFVGLVTDITKQGPLQYPYQRSSVFLSLLNAAERLTVISDPIDVDTNAVVASLLPLLPVIEKEASEEARCLGIRAIGAWARFVPSLPELVLKLFTTQIKSDKEPIRAATIEAIESAVSQKPSSIDSDLGSHELLKPDSEKAQQVVAFVDALAAPIKNAKGPKNADTSLVSAARVLVKLSVSNPAFDAKIDKTVWQAILGAGSFLFQPVFLARFNEKEALSFLQLLESVLVLAFARLKNADAAFFASYTWLLTHPLWPVRRAAIQTTKRLHPQLPKLADLLTGAAIKLVHDVSGAIAANAGAGVNANANANANAETSPVPTPQVLGTLLSTAASPSLSDSLLPALFTAAHLPYVENRTWQNICKSLGKLSGDMLGKEEMAKAVVDRLMSHDVLLNKDANLQAAGQRALATASQDSGDTIVPNAITLFQDLLSKDILSTISAKDVAIYHHPEGELYEKVEKEYVPKLREDKKQAAVPKEHKRRGERGLYSKADLAFEEKLRKELEEKKKKEEEAAKAKPKYSDAELKVLAKESQIRANAAQVRANISNALKGLRAIAVANQDISHGYLRTFIDLLLPIVSHPLTSDLTFPVLEALSRCLQPPAQALAHPVAHLILTIYAPLPAGELAPEKPDPSLLWELQKVLGAVQAHGKPLGASSFSFLFPIIKSCLEKMYTFVIQETALEVVEIHLSHGGNYPRGAMIASLAAVVATTARLEPRAKAAIITLGSGLRTTDMAQACAAYVSPDANVRNAVLSAIAKTPALATSTFPEMEALTSVVWAAQYDTDTANVAIAESTWKKYAHPLTPDASKYLDLFLPHLSHKQTEVRLIYAGAIAGAMRTHPDSIAAAIEQLFSMYENLLPLDGDREHDTPENIQLRCGVATTVGKAADAFQGENLANVFHWMIDASLGDSEEIVNQELVQSGMEVVSVQGSKNQGIMYPIFEKFLARHDTGTRRQDQVRESVIVFMGVIAKHMLGDEARVSSILTRLVEALKTPSELVQVAVSKCLTQLAPSVRPKAEELLTRLLEILRTGKGGYALMRGTAYGLAGVVKGLGLISLKKHDVFAVLGAGVEDKKAQGARQAAVLAYECLSNTLGRGFEPYVKEILPKLLICIGDSSIEVRNAATASAKKIMGQLSPHGVKLLLPVLLKPVEDKSGSWRTKEGSIELLGAMAFCAPKQLSSCLPTIVPRLVEVLMDTHEAVQKATREALSHVGSVIRNPEVQLHVKKILRALYDPETTKDALEALLNTNFVHSIDAPSLSLIMPLLDRGLRDRGTETKKRAAQIVGNMCSLTDPHELIPYLSVLIPNLKGVVTDPIPEVRTLAAVAMGSLVSGMGEEQFSTLITWMLETIRSDLGSVERSGAAQGLSQVLGALGPEKLQNLFPDLVAGTHSSKFYVREGAMYMFSFLPIGMQRGFQAFLPKVLPCVLGGLADDSEIVREVALRAGQTIVSEYYTSAVDVLVPCLEEGLFSDNWRIRQSSVSLLGDFMAKITGGDMSDATEEDSDRTARAKTDITKAMGEERVHSILAALYMIRFDVNTAVRQKTMQVWKGLVNNTPKTLREILPTLMSTLIACMGSSNLDKRQVAARTLGDLVSKLGERVLPDIIPMLERGLDSKDKDRRLGVCVGLAEVISAAGKQQLGTYLADIIPTVRIALQDRLPEVREGAAQAFDMLYAAVGPKVLDDILPPLLAALSKERTAEGETSPAGDALRQILLVRSQAVLPFLIPKLIARPLTPANAAALSSVASVAGAALNEHLGEILPVLLEEATNPSRSAEDIKAIKAATETIILAVEDEGLDILIPELQQQIESEEPTTRAGAADLLAAFCASTKADLEPFAHDLIVSLLGLFNDSDEKVLLAAWNALGSVTKTIKKENLSFIEAVDEGIEQVSDELPDEDEKVLPGFCIPKGLQPILPLLLNGLMLGSPEQRELSAVVIGQTIKLTSSDALKPFVVQITGPLIRVIADRFPWQVKSAILSTLTLLIGKGAAAMKPFLPQLQTTFIKALHDPTALVRKNAALALGKLMALTVRIDPLLNELLAGVSATEGGVQEGMIAALRRVLEKAPASVDPAALLKVANAMADLLEHNEENVRVAAAKTLAVYAKVAPAEQFDTFFNKTILEQEGATWQGRHGRSVAIFQLLKTQPQPDLANKHFKNIATRLQQEVKDDKAGVKQYAAESYGCLLQLAPTKSAELVNSLAQLINDPTSDVALAALRGTKRFAKAHPSVMSKHLATFIPLVVARLKDKVLPVKIEAERVLVHALQIFSNPDILKDYVASTDPVFSRYLTDYVTRVIKKLNPQSDAEEEDEDDT